MRCPKLKRFNELSWKLLEYKCYYYRPEWVHETRKKDLFISDWEYDKLEMEYSRLGKELLKNLDICQLVDFSEFTPSGRLIISKLSKPIDYNFEELLK